MRRVELKLYVDLIRPRTAVPFRVLNDWSVMFNFVYNNTFLSQLSTVGP